MKEETFQEDKPRTSVPLLIVTFVYFVMVTYYFKATVFHSILLEGLTFLNVKRKIKLINT